MAMRWRQDEEELYGDMVVQMHIQAALFSKLFPKWVSHSAQGQHVLLLLQHMQSRTQVLPETLSLIKSAHAHTLLISNLHTCTHLADIKLALIPKCLGQLTPAIKDQQQSLPTARTGRIQPPVARGRCQAAV